MGWFRRWLDDWRRKRQSKLRRVILLEFIGLEPALVDAYLEQGLLHHLALLADVGTRSVVPAPATGHVADSICESLRRLGVASVELPSVPPQPPVDVAAICAADRDQQERLLAALARRRPTGVVASFDMPAQLRQLFGSNPNKSQRLVLRDVYARMDEIVGKALSFVDSHALLFAVVPQKKGGEDAPPAAGPELLFSSRSLAPGSEEETDVGTAILGLLRPA